MDTHWFDLITLAGLGWGVHRGRRYGISGELLYLLQWLAIFFICGTFYASPAERLANWLHVNQNVMSVVMYVFIAAIVKSCFGLIMRLVGNKLVTRDCFGKWEYYLGMLTGMARMTCVVYVGLALLSATYFTEQSLYSMDAYQKENFGGITFPTLSQMKRDSLTDSMSGRLANRHFGRFLIDAVPPQPQAPLRLPEQTASNELGM